MSDQVQCPNCGGYKLNSWKGSIKKTFPLSQKERAFRVGGSLILTGVSVLAWRAFSPKPLSDVSCILNVFVVVSLIALVSSLTKTTRTKVIGNGYSFTCLLCGYRWEWLEGQPWPEAHVKPDLITMGARRLEEEEEAERRRHEEKKKAEERQKREKEEAERRKIEKIARDTDIRFP